MAEQVDVVVIGMGPGGEEVAGSLAEAGLAVVGIEERLVGGECPYFACVPTKMMVRAAGLVTEGHRITGMAGTAMVAPDWRPVARRIRAEATDDWNDKVAVDRFTEKGGSFVRGRGRITGPGEVTVDGGNGRAGADKVFTARRAVVVATGTAPAVPPIPGLEGTPYWTNRDVVRLTELPRSLVVLGGGAVGVELAQVHARFGVDVTLVEAADTLLPLEEPEAGQLIAHCLEVDGVVVRVGAQVASVHHDGHGFSIDLADGESVTADRLLVATGRRTDLAGIGATEIGIDPKEKFLPVDERMRVEGASGVWAVGDVAGKGAFTHVAVYQARIAAADILGRQPRPADYRALPRVTFTDPEVGSVGLGEAEARRQGITVRAGTAQVPSSARGWIHKVGNTGLIKLVADAERGVLVGATSVGPTGGEVLGLLTLAVHAEVPIESLTGMIYAYPTFHRGVEDALRDLATQ